MSRPVVRAAALCVSLCLLSTPSWGLSCTTSASALAFGVYNPFSGSPNDTSATVTVTCEQFLVGIGVSYQIALSAGSAGNFSPRKLVGPTATRLNYQIYRDASRTQVWGDGSGGTNVVADGILLLLGTVTRTYTAYGRIPASQQVPPGGYADTVVVLVTY